MDLYLNSVLYICHFQQVPNFGFIVFEDAASVERALSAKPILLWGNHRLNVEEKKMRGGDRDRAGPGGFNMDRGDMGKRGSQVGHTTGLLDMMCLLQR